MKMNEEGETEYLLRVVAGFVIINDRKKKKRKVWDRV